mmetsp:Transcript_91619/g.153535  ORF Transcript_91619/g.153535 Transcript_91619/m.153535 type:complete len:84 (-) Transcript_91619:558-809(-)
MNGPFCLLGGSVHALPDLLLKPLVCAQFCPMKWMYCANSESITLEIHCSRCSGNDESTQSQRTANHHCQLTATTAGLHNLTTD